MDDIFISYARDDRELVERLHARLEALGYRCWFERDLTIGKQHRDQVVRRIESARCVLVAWSPHAAASPWVQDEAERALKLNRLVSVTVAPCRLPDMFQSVPTLDLTAALSSDGPGAPTEAWAALQQAIVAVAGTPSLASPIKAAPARESKPRASADRKGSRGAALAALTVAALIAGAALGGGGAFLLQPSGASVLPYSAAALPADVRPAVAAARSARAEAQKNAEEALKKAKAALYHANIARHGAEPGYEVRAVTPSAPGAFDYYFGQKIQEGSTSLGMTNVTLNAAGLIDPRGDHHLDYLGEHEGVMFGGLGVRVVDGTEYMQGRFHDGVPDGAGVLIQADRSRYEGAFDKDRQDGFAVEIGPDGAVVYEGAWKSGERDGPGVEWREAGCVYVAGVWSIGKIARPTTRRLCTPTPAP